MSVTITITDPSSTPPEELQAVVTMLRSFAPSEPTARTQARLDAIAPEPAAPVEAPEVFETASPVPPPPVPEATAAFAPPPPPPAPAPTGIELDKDGIPWDGRIHASTKTKTVEGVWKKKRGIEPAAVDEVTAELRAVMAVPPPQVAVSSDPTPSPVAVPAPPAPPAPPAATGVSFAEFMGHVTAGVTSARFTREEVAAACVKTGVPNLPGLINRPDLIPSVARELGLMA